MIRFDHAIIAVDDLAHAVHGYSQLGFHVLSGGRHANQATHNALIVFADGSYLELIALTGEAPVVGLADYSAYVHTGPGLVGCAFSAWVLAQHVSHLREYGLMSQTMQDGGRVLPSGEALQWRIASLDQPLAPFFIEDVTPRENRVPFNTSAAVHPNGVQGISDVVFLTTDRHTSVDYFGQLLGQEADADGGFRLGETRVLLQIPADDPAQLHLMQRPLAPYALNLSVAAGTMVTMDVELAQQAMLRLNPAR